MAPPLPYILPHKLRQSALKKEGRYTGKTV